MEHLTEPHWRQLAVVADEQQAHALRQQVQQAVDAGGVEHAGLVQHQQCAWREGHIPFGPVPRWVVGLGFLAFQHLDQPGNRVGQPGACRRRCATRQGQRRLAWQGSQHHVTTQKLPRGGDHTHGGGLAHAGTALQHSQRQPKQMFYPSRLFALQCDASRKLGIYYQPSQGIAGGQVDAGRLLLDSPQCGGHTFFQPGSAGHTHHMARQPEGVRCIGMLKAKVWIDPAVTQQCGDALRLDSGVAGQEQVAVHAAQCAHQPLGMRCEVRARLSFTQQALAHTVDHRPVHQAGGHVGVAQQPGVGIVTRQQAPQLAGRAGFTHAQRLQPTQEFHLGGLELAGCGVTGRCGKHLGGNAQRQGWLCGVQHLGHLAQAGGVTQGGGQVTAIPGQQALGPHLADVGQAGQPWHQQMAVQGLAGHALAVDLWDGAPVAVCVWREQAHHPEGVARKRLRVVALESHPNGNAIFLRCREDAAAFQLRQHPLDNHHGVVVLHQSSSGTRVPPLMRSSRARSRMFSACSRWLSASRSPMRCNSSACTASASTAAWVASLAC